LPPEGKELVWQSIDDYNMTIKFDTNPYTGKQDFFDVTKPDVLYTVTTAPDWMFF